MSKEIVFTKREMEVLAILAQGDASSKEILKITRSGQVPQVAKRINDRAGEKVIVNLSPPPNIGIYRLLGGNLNPVYPEAKEPTVKSIKGRKPEQKRRKNESRIKNPEVFKKQLKDPVNPEMINSSPAYSGNGHVEQAVEIQTYKAFLETLPPTERNFYPNLLTSSFETPFFPNNDSQEQIIEVIIRNKVVPPGHRLIHILKEGTKGYYLKKENY